MSAANQACQPYLGARVIRGPDWKWDNQDGGEGHVGTLHKYESSETVFVLWDHGTNANYRFGSAHDLRILDSAPAGIKHAGVTCDGCNETPLHGIRWKCAECDDYDLCSMCYHGDKHNLQHKFLRMELNSETRTLVGPRSNCRKIAAFGLFKGARVTRGADWEYGSQDGILFIRGGEITEIKEWQNSIPRSAARVAWDIGRGNIYRIGFEGKVDIKAINKAKGYSFYRDHLPVLSKVARSTNLAIGDRVKIELDEMAVHLLQLGHGGWNDGMKETLSNTGKIVGFDRDNDVSVVYPSGNRWILNPAVLTRVNATTINGSSFGVGDTVRISSDLERVIELQKGHGEWINAMAPTLGKVGEVKRVLPTNDLKVEVAGKIWTFNSECVSKVDTTVDDVAEQFSDMLLKLFAPGLSTNPTREMIQAAEKDNVQKIRMLLSNGKVKINDSVNGVTAILAASFNGSVQVVKFLIQNGVDLESKDKDGDRAVHNAAHGNEAEVLKLLAQAGADINAKNDKNQSALHIAVNKGYTRIVSCLLASKARPSIQDSFGDTPLHDAITKEEDEIIQLLLQFKADISVKNNKGFNCLHHAALKGSVSAITALLAINSHPWIINEKKEDGFTALHLASLNKHQKVAEMLITQGKADINAQNNKLQTSLHIAVVGQNLQMVQLLVEEGASLDLKDEDGDTPMHEAIRHHTLFQLKQLQDSTNIAMALLGLGNAISDPKTSFSIACFLASHGTDLTVRNNENQTPLDLCLDQSLSEAISNWHVPRPRDSVASQEVVSSRTSGSARTMSPTGSPGTEGATGRAANVEVTGSGNTRGATANTSARENSGGAAAVQEVDTSCIICSDNPRDTLFIPCYHIAVCALCSPRVKKCLICKAHVESTIQLEECFVCSDKKPNVLFKPCNHICVCSDCAKVMKKCAQCRKPIEETVSYADLCGANYSRNIEISNVAANDSNVASGQVNQLTQELTAMKEQMMCPICMDNRRNMVFLCGHGTCKDCGNRIRECPMCRKAIEKRVLLFQ